MFRSANELLGNTIEAQDARVGSVDDLYFDDLSWTVRYIVADTDKLSSAGKVLLSPVSVGRAADEGQIEVDLTAEQIQSAPDIDAARPVSRQHEARYNDHYGWPYYWQGAGLLAMAPYAPADLAEAAEGKPSERGTDDPNLQSVKEVVGYTMDTLDDQKGHLEDVLIDDKTWHVRYLVVDTGLWWMGKKILVSPALISRVDWANRALGVRLTTEEIKQSPEWDGELPVKPEYEDRLYEHYRRMTSVV